MNMAFSSVAGSGDPVLTFALVCGGRFANVTTKGAPEISDSDAVLDLASPLGQAEPPKRMPNPPHHAGAYPSLADGDGKRTVKG
jgi:hypothetical protein